MLLYVCGLNIGVYLITAVPLAVVIAGSVMFVVGRTHKKRALWITGIVLGALGILAAGSFITMAALLLRPFHT